MSTKSAAMGEGGGTRRRARRVGQTPACIAKSSGVSRRRIPKRTAVSLLADELAASNQDALHLSGVRTKIS